MDGILIETVKISDARGRLLKVDTGINRRLLYLASGGDVGCSLGLFWHKCDSFYLVDPEFGKGIKYDSVINQLAKGSAGYMLGVQVLAESYEEGHWESAFPGRRYQVYMKGTPSMKKRLCFVRAGSNDWLSSTTCHYNVILDKDYAGIQGSGDDDYPYERVWGRLNRCGIFGETIGSGRSDEATDFANYRYRGFEPLMKVISDTGGIIGFGSGFVLFKKRIDGDEEYFKGRKSYLDLIFKRVTKKLDIFPYTGDFHPSVIENKDDDDYKALYKLMKQPGINNWHKLSTDPCFAGWLRTQLLPQDAQIDQQLLFDIISPLNLRSWGGW